MTTLLDAPRVPAPSPAAVANMRQSALIWIAGGATSAGEFALAEDPAFYFNAYNRQSDGTPLGDLFMRYVGNGEAAATKTVADTIARATAMAALEADGWTQKTALDALRAGRGA